MKRYYLNNSGTYLTYGVCQKNQAERVGGHALDGCQSFCPSGEEGTPASLICAACQCQRSFHQLQVHTEDAPNNPNNNDPSPPPPQQQGTN